MQKQSSDIKKIRLLASNVGDFIRYWGFRRIHGEIWALVYLSETSLSGVEIVRTLKVSKALVSPALKDLEEEGLIKQTTSENSKVKRYTAVEDVVAVIKNVLKRREKLMLEKVRKSYEAISPPDLPSHGLRADRFHQMGVMIQTALLGLQTLLSFEIAE